MSAFPAFSAAAMGRPFIFPLPPSPRATAEIAAKKTAEILAAVGAIPKLAAVVPASRLEARPAPEMVSSGIPQLDSLTGGLPRGCLTEICGAPSSGRTSVLLFALARATERGEVCALVDASDAFDPASAAAAGMDLGRLLWVRCGPSNSPRKDKDKNKNNNNNNNNNKARVMIRPSGRAKTSTSYQVMPDQLMPDSYRNIPSAIPQDFREGHDFSRAASPAQSSPALAAEGSRGLQRGNFSRWNNPEGQRWESQLGQMLKVTDLLLQSNGFGMIALDLADVPVPSVRRIPLASWFRFRRAIEHTPTVLLVLEQQPIAGSCSSVLLRVSGASPRPPGNQPVHSQLPHSKLLDQFEITAELLCARLEQKVDRKPAQSTASFTSRAAWAG
ncbi:MAG: hypothetical protein ACLQBU_10980 [Terriglobales bacterium]